MTKQETIAQAYGKDYEKYNPDENGWSGCHVYQPDFLLDWDYKNFRPENEKHHKTAYERRPKSLRGIENNNGWIKIKEKEDLPKNESDCWFIHNEQKIKGNFIHNKFTCWFGHFGWKTISHYQLITVPKDYLY